MIQYKYHRAVSLDDVMSVLREYGGKARIVAEGTDILIQIHEKDGQRKDLRCLLDITYLGKELRYIDEDKEYVHIGSLSTHTDLGQPEIITKHIPFLGWASATVGFPQIRNRETLGGSIGNGFPTSDPLSVLVAADVLIRVYGQNGEREYLLKDFYEGKGSLKLEPRELIRKFVVKKLPKGTRMGFSKLGRRKALVISKLNCATALTLDSEGTTTEVRVAPGCIFVQPDRVEKVEQVFIGQKPSEELFAKAGKAVSKAMIEYTGARWSTQCKEPVVQEITLHALCQTVRMEVQQWRR